MSDFPVVYCYFDGKPCLFSLNCTPVNVRTGKIRFCSRYKGSRGRIPEHRVSWRERGYYL